MFGFLTKAKESIVEANQQREIERAKAQEENQKLLFAELVEMAKDFSVVKFDGCNVSFNVDTPKSATISKKELSILKRMANAKKREINVEYKSIRAEYSQEVGNRSIMIPGGGAFIRAVNTATRIQRASARGTMANITKAKADQIRPWDQLISVLDRAIIKCSLHD